MNNHSFLGRIRHNRLKKANLNVINLIFSRKWMLTTILVFLAIVVMVRLGIWQLDRLEQRRNFNAHYLQQIEAPTVELTPDNFELDLEGMEYRQIIARGDYDYNHEMAIRNQSWQGQAGVHLLTPLIISESNHIVFINRGWIPLDAYQQGDWRDYHEGGNITIAGIIRSSQTAPTFGGRSDPPLQQGEIRKAWNFVDIQSISKQINAPVIPIYIQQSPDPSRTDPPYQNKLVVEINEGPHLSYAIQWFIFSIILALGYPVYLQREALKSTDQISEVKSSEYKH